MPFTRKLAIVVVLLGTAVVGQPALDPDEGALFARTALQRGDAIRQRRSTVTLRLLAADDATFRLESSDDGRVRLRLEDPGKHLVTINSAAFDYVQDGADVWLVAVDNDTDVTHVQADADEFRYRAHTFELHLSATHWTMTGGWVLLR